MLFTRVMRTVGWRSTNETLLFTEKNLSRRATLNLQTTHDATLSASVMSCHPEKGYRLIFGWRESWSETRKKRKKRSNLVVYPILMFVASFSALNINAQQREDSHEWVDSRWSSDVSLTDEITSTQLKNYFQREHRWVLRLWMKPSRAWVMQDVWGQRWYQYQNSSIDHNHRIHEHIWTLKCC